eukprot:jgi/Mesvir1/13716/Mv26024-RA.1
MAHDAFKHHVAFISTLLLIVSTSFGVRASTDTSAQGGSDRGTSIKILRSAGGPAEAERASSASAWSTLVNSTQQGDHEDDTLRSVDATSTSWHANYLPDSKLVGTTNLRGELSEASGSPSPLHAQRNTTRNVFAHSMRSSWQLITDTALLYGAWAGPKGSLALCARNFTAAFLGSSPVYSTATISSSLLDDMSRPVTVYSLGRGQEGWEGGERAKQHPGLGNEGNQCASQHAACPARSAGPHEHDAAEAEEAGDQVSWAYHHGCLFQIIAFLQLAVANTATFYQKGNQHRVVGMLWLCSSHARYIVWHPWMGGHVNCVGVASFRNPPWLSHVGMSENRGGVGQFLAPMDVWA